MEQLLSKIMHMLFGQKPQTEEHIDNTSLNQDDTAISERDETELSNAGGSSGGGSGEGNQTEEEEEQDKNSTSASDINDGFENEETVGKVNAQGQGVDEHEESEERDENFAASSEQADSQERSAAEIDKDAPEIESDELTLMEDLLDGIETTKLAGVRGSEVELDDQGNIIQTQNNRELPITEEAIEIKRQRNEAFAAGREDIPKDNAANT